MDNLTKAQRSRCMRNVRTRHTDIELRLATALRSAGYRFTLHSRDLPGSPDLVFKEARIAVFVDGDFWHGWRLPAWEAKLSAFWREKLRRNRQRDTATQRKLRQRGWQVLRIWEHQLERDFAQCVSRVERKLMAGTPLMKSLSLRTGARPHRGH
jgi:DNA mismatch endonuclease (patch repair protein)